MSKYYTSQAEEIKKHTCELLADGTPHRLGEIKEFVQARADKSFTAGAFAGAMRDLVYKHQDYKTTGRGYYIYSPALTDQMVTANTKTADYSLGSAYHDVLKQTIAALEEKSKTNVLNLTDKDLQNIQEAKKIINYLEEAICHLSE